MGAVRIGSVIEELLGDGEQPCDVCAYVLVNATVDGNEVRLATLVGVPESDRASCSASGGDLKTYLTTWQQDSSDLESVPEEHRDAVRSALHRAGPRIWSDVQELREGH